MLHNERMIVGRLAYDICHIKSGTEDGKTGATRACGYNCVITNLLYLIYEPLFYS